MEQTKTVWRWVRRVLVVAFCAAHLTFMVTNALPADMRREIIDAAANKDEKKADSGQTQAWETVQSYIDISRGYERLTSTPQSWGMFAPNVGDESDSPCLVIFYVNGVQEILYSPCQPRLINIEPTFNFLLKFGELEQRKKADPHVMDVTWPLHLGDARIRKIESYVTKMSDQYGANGPRTAYVRWRLIDHLRRNPARQGQVSMVRLFCASYQHAEVNGNPGYGRAYLERVRLLAEYRPALDPMWPKNLPAEPKP
ncbi:MAG: hypothetical protein IT462_03810 [Planctomycetes bacterium]|nr:hypothetical protein [Planctomycetota bacterium]